MSSYSVPVEHHQIFLPVLVSDPARAPNRTASAEYTALVDTGATGTMISGQVVSDLDLEEFGTDTFIAANGEQTLTTVHRVAVAVPVTSGPPAMPPGLRSREISIRKNVVALGLPRQIPGFDLLLGMDVLIDFRIVIDKGVFTISR